MTAAKNNNGLHHYVYDQNGQRIMKSSLTQTGAGSDGQLEGGYILSPYTVYTNPYYLETTYNGTTEASKHYYLGSQRVASSLISFPYDPPPPSEVIGPGGLAPPPLVPYTGTYGVFYNLDSVLNHFNLQEGTDYQWSDLQYRDSAKTQDMYPSLNDFEMAIGNCSSGQPDYQACLCEHSRYWAERYGDENDLDINCDSYDLSYWYHPDYLGNTEFVTDADGAPFQYFWYSAWGEAIESQHSNQGSFSSRYRFNAKEWDAETGNYYYGARYYDPKVSNWLSVDSKAD